MLLLEGWIKDFTPPRLSKIDRDNKFFEEASFIRSDMFSLLKGSRRYPGHHDFNWIAGYITQRAHQLRIIYRKLDRPKDVRKLTNYIRRVRRKHGQFFKDKLEPLKKPKLPNTGEVDLSHTNTLKKVDKNVIGLTKMQCSRRQDCTIVAASLLLNQPYEKVYKSVEKLSGHRYDPDVYAPEHSNLNRPMISDVKKLGFHKFMLKQNVKMDLGKSGKYYDMSPFDLLTGDNQITRKAKKVLLILKGTHDNSTYHTVVAIKNTKGTWVLYDHAHRRGGVDNRTNIWILFQR